MIDFEEEIKKFKPCLEVEDAEDAIYNNNVPDVTDLINKILEDARTVSYTHLTLPTKA